MGMLYLGLVQDLWALEVQEKKVAAENGEKTIKSITDTLTNAIALSNLAPKTKNGKFH